MGAVASALSIGPNLIMGLLAKHDARVQAAKEENAATNQAVQAMDSDLATIFNHANAGDISPQVAMGLLNDVHAWYWAFVAPFQMGSAKGNICSKKFPDNLDCFSDPVYQCKGKECTAACCLGCNTIGPSLSRAYQLFKTGKAGTIKICDVFGSKYGGVARAGYSLTYTPPPAIIPVEATINKVSGLIAIGVSPSQNDIVVASGALIDPNTGARTQANALASLLGSSSKLPLIAGAGLALVFIGMIALGGKHASQN